MERKHDAKCKLPAMHLAELHDRFSRFLSPSRAIRDLPELMLWPFWVVRNGAVRICLDVLEFGMGSYSGEALEAPCNHALLPSRSSFGRSATPKRATATDKLEVQNTPS